MINFGKYLSDYLDANNISQSEFALRLGTTQKHINEIINGATGMSVNMIANIEKLTNISSQFIIKIEEKNNLYKKLIQKFGNMEELANYLKDFKLNELEVKKWVTFKDKTSSFQNASDLLSFMKIADFDVLKDQEKNMLFKKNGDDFNKINLWIARCNELALNQIVEDYDPKKFEKLINELKDVAYSKKVNNDEIRELLNKYGFYFVVEQALNGTKIRGAFLVKKDNPAIFMTVNYPAKDSFYFQLFHELGHCKSDFCTAKKNVIIDGDIDKENRADKFALETMIPENIWKDIIADKSIENIVYISKKEKIPMSFIVGRLANNGYIKYADRLYQTYKNI